MRGVPLLVVFLASSSSAMTGSLGGGASLGGRATSSAIGGSGAAIGPPFSIADTCVLPVTPLLHYAARLDTSYANNDPVTVANDYGTQNDDLSQGTGAAQPTYKSSGPGGKPYWLLDGGDWLESTSALTLNITEWWVCAVVNTGAAGAAAATVFADDVSTTRKLGEQGTTNEAQANFGAAVNAGTTAANSWRLHCYANVAGAGSDEIWINGSAAVTGSDFGANDFDRARIGANNTGTTTWAGGIAEVALWTAYPDFDAVEAELESPACYGNNFPFAGTP